MIENWIELVIGVLVLVSPWVFGFAEISLARWLNIICGAILVVMNTWMLYGKAPAAVEEASGLVQKPKRVRRKKSSSL